MMIQTTLYTQAKGAQYLLLCLYFVMLLPFAALYKSFGPIKLRNPFKKIELSNKVVATSTFFVLLLFVFSTFLWVPRVIYAYRIGHHKDRSTVMEPSFFAEARKIKAEDKNAFVLFEPRNSSDTIFPFQAFAGYKLVPTRHLILEQLFPGDRGGTGHRVYKLPSDFVSPDDIPYLWSLTAIKEKQGKYRWKAKRLIRKTTPQLIFTGYDYQRDFAVKSRFKRKDLVSKPAESGMFSYLRNGTVMIYLPPGGPYHLEIKVFNRDGTNLEEFYLMKNEIEKRIRSGEFKSISSINKKDGVITLLFDFKFSTDPRLSLIARHGHEYWFNARLNKKEMVASRVG